MRAAGGERLNIQVCHSSRLVRPEAADPVTGPAKSSRGSLHASPHMANSLLRRSVTSIAPG